MTKTSNYKNNIFKVNKLNFELTLGKFSKITIEERHKLKIPDLFAVVKKDVIIGCFTFGDYRRKYLKFREKDKITKIMKKNPICIYEDQLIDKEKHIKQILNKRKNISGIFVINRQKKLLGVLAINNNQLNSLTDIDNCGTNIIGLGFVGLSLALHLSSKGIYVEGFDTSHSIISNLNRKKAHIYEEGFNSMLKIVSKNKKIKFFNSCNFNIENNVFIICVGTPVVNNKINLVSVKNAIKKIAPLIKYGSLVVMRSTIPLGSSREIFIPMIEKISKLKCGIDWHYTFAPERAVTGKSLEELNTVPQIIGSFSDQCSRIAKEYFSHSSLSILTADKIEEAELSKLICNTYRNVTFSFSNEVADICTKYNINAHNLINLSNEGYPRGGIPTPSPGVGGTCLTKDPSIYSLISLSKKSKQKPVLGQISKKINEKAALVPKLVINNFFKINKNKINKKILVLGFAFKGFPLTNDTRDSVAKEFAIYCKKKGFEVFVFDPVLSPKEIKEYGFKYFNIKNKISNKISAVFIMNNNSIFREINWGNWLDNKKNKLIFDGWAIFPELNNDKNKLIYSTMGKMI